MRFLLAGIILFPSWLFLLAQDPSVSVDRVVVYKRERKLLLLSHAREVRPYKVALGSEAVGPKTRQATTEPPRDLCSRCAKPEQSLLQSVSHLVPKLERPRSRQDFGSESGR